jgi:hypothetical protein
MQHQSLQEVAVMNSIDRVIPGYGMGSMIYGTGSLWAQISPGPTRSPAVPPESTPHVADGLAGLFVAAALIVLLAAMILVAKVYDLSRKREEQADSLEARISNSLLADPLLSRLPVVPTVRIPLWRGRPVIIAMTGSVPRSQLRHAALEMALREVGRSVRSYRLEDRILVDPAMARRAA